MGPQDPKDGTRDTTRDLSSVSLQRREPLYQRPFIYRLEVSHAAAEAALIEARRRVRLNEGQER
jgi:hypothetical protein